MLIDFTVGASIDIQDALKLADVYKFESISSSGARSRRHKEAGISEIRLNIDVKRLLKYPTKPVCQINADIDMSRFEDSDGNPNLKRLKEQLDSIIAPSGVNDLDWKMIYCKFEKVIETAYVDQYMNLIKNIRKPKGRGDTLKTKQDESSSGSKKMIYSNGSRELTLDIKQDAIILYLSISNSKLNYSVKRKDYGISSKLIDQIDANSFKNMELQLWNEYLSRLFGESDYYSQSEAEKVIKEKCKSIGTRHKLEAVLKGIAVYKGIDAFMDHVEDKEPKYEFMEEIRSKSTANKCIRDLDTVYGVNPIVISRRDAAALEISCLPSFVKLVGVLDHKPQKRKRQKNKSKDAEYPPF